MHHNTITILESHIILMNSIDFYAPASDDAGGM